MRRRLGTTPLFGGGVGTGFGGVTSNDLQFLDQALASQERQMALQNSQLTFAANLQRFERQNYEFERQMKYDAVVDKGRADAISRVKSMTLEDEDALDKINEEYLSLPQEVLTDPVVRQVFASAEKRATSFDRERRDRDRVAQGAMAGFSDQLVNLNPDNQTFVNELNMKMLSGETSTADALNLVRGRLLDETVTQVQTGVSQMVERAQSNPELLNKFAQKFKIPLNELGELQTNGMAQYEHVMEHMFADEKSLGLKFSEFNGLDQEEKYEMLAKFTGRSKAVVGYLNGQIEQENKIRAKQNELDVNSLNRQIAENKSGQIALYKELGGDVNENKIIQEKIDALEENSIELEKKLKEMITPNGLDL